MPPASLQSSRVLVVSVVLLSSLAWAGKPDQGARAACINETTPLFSASWAGRADYVARLCKRPTPSTASCVREVVPSITNMSNWEQIVENLCSRANPNTASCFLQVRNEQSSRPDWLDIALSQCR